MQNGIYCATFSIAGESEAGVVVLRDGSLSGGDSGSYYIGDYSVDRDIFQANVKINVHTKKPDLFYVFGDEEGEVTISGTATETSVTATGTSPQLEGITFDCNLRLIAKQ